MLGVRFRYRYPVSMGLSDFMTKIRSGSISGTGIEKLAVTCLYPAQYRIETRTAVIESTATVTKVQPDTKLLDTQTARSAWGNGDHSLSALANSKTWAAVSATPTELGRYQALASTLVQSVSVKVYTSADGLTGAKPADEIVSIGAPYRTAPSQARGTMLCDGWHDGWESGDDFTEASCQAGNTNGKPVTYQCVGDQGVTIDGQGLSSAYIVRDGEPHAISWGLPTFTSPDLVAIESTATKVARSGTPWTASRAATSNDVELWRGGSNRLTSADGTGWMTGSLGSDWQFYATWASDAGAPTVLTPSVRWGATLNKRTITITGVSSDGEWQTSTVVVPVRTTLTCSGTPLSLHITRTVNNG